MADEYVLTLEENEAYEMALSIGIDFPDNLMLIRALRCHQNNVNAVVGEYYDMISTDKWVEKYKNKPPPPTSGWNAWEGMPGLEATETSGLAPLLGAASSPSFRIQGEDQEVLYGQTPGTTGAPPTRAPSRADNRTPGFTERAPTSREQEEQDIQEAMKLSLEGQAPPPPPRPSSPVKVQFGPATREHYSERDWTATTSYYSPPLEDEVPSCRSRRAGLPAFLRCRPSHNSHMLGGLLVILQRIPAARNTLLKTGTDPAWGYQCTQNWWKGEPITGQGPRWEYEVHRLMAFLEGTTRAYATADILAQFPQPPSYCSDDEEKEFFQKFVYSTTLEDASNPLPFERYSVLMADVEVVPVADLTGHQSSDYFGALDLYLPDINYEGRGPKTLYDYLDLIFYPDVTVAAEDIDQGMLAMVSNPSEVLTMRFRDDRASNVEIPEVFYLDRYMARNHERVAELAMEQINLFKRKKKATDMAEARATFTPSCSDRSKSRKELAAATIKTLKSKIEKMEKQALWRNYDEAYATGEDAIYLPASDDEPSWLDKEKEILAHYNIRIEQLEQVIARTDDLTKRLKVAVLDPIDADYEANAAKFTTPSEDEKWNPTQKYTLVGAVIGDSQVLLRWTGEPLDEVIQEGSPPGAPDMGGWWLKMSYRNRVEYEFVKLKSVLEMWNNAKTSRMLVYATDLALSEEHIPLYEKLQKFVRDDNYFFNKELEAEKSKEPEAEASKKRGVDDEWAAVSGSGKLQRSASMDTLASDRASAGSQNGGEREDEEMLDVSGETGGGGGSLGEKGVSVVVQEMVERPTSSFFPMVTGAHAYGMAQSDSTGTATDVGNIGSSGGYGNGSGSAANPIKINGNGDGMVTD